MRLLLAAALLLAGCSSAVASEPASSADESVTFVSHNFGFQTMFCAIYHPDGDHSHDKFQCTAIR